MRKAKYRERMYCKLYVLDSIVTLLGVNHSGDMAWISRGRRVERLKGAHQPHQTVETITFGRETGDNARSCKSRKSA